MENLLVSTVYVIAATAFAEAHLFELLIIDWLM